jgi:hypothetical protein
MRSLKVNFDATTRTTVMRSRKQNSTYKLLTFNNSPHKNQPVPANGSNTSEFGWTAARFDMRKPSSGSIVVPPQNSYASR